MKYNISACLTAGLLLWTTSLFAADFAGQTGFSYQSWTSDEDESGGQFYLPLDVQSEMDQLSWHLTTGYANTTGELQDDGERCVSGMLDTQVGLAYQLSGAGLDWLLGLDVNVPTGQDGLDENDVRIMVDPDLVSIITPGQGMNINPAVSVTRQWELVALGASVGYAFQGEYDYSKQTRKYDPGDILKVAAEADWTISTVWQWRVETQFLTVGADRVGGEDYLQKGDTWLLGTTLARAVDRWELEMSVNAIFRSKAAVEDSDGDLVTESRVSQGNEWILDIVSRHQLRPATHLEVAVQYLYLAENDYDEDSRYYMGNRQKYTLSLSVVQQFNANFELHCALDGFAMDDEPSWLHPGEDRQYQGGALTAAIVQHF